MTFRRRCAHAVPMSIQVAVHETTVKRACREVSDTLAARWYLPEQIAVQARTVATNPALADLVHPRYDNGAFLLEQYRFKLRQQSDKIARKNKG